MEVTVDVAGKQINDALAKAILDSVIGESLLKTVEKEVGKIVDGYRGNLGTLVNQEITNHIREMLRTEYKEKIKSAVREKLNSHETINAAVEMVISKMAKEDY